MDKSSTKHSRGQYHSSLSPLIMRLMIVIILCILDDALVIREVVRRSFVGAARPEQEIYLSGKSVQVDQQHTYEEKAFARMNRMIARRSQAVGKIPVNVDSFGAVGDGVADDTQAFRNAWETACSLRNAVYLVPEGRRYLVKAIRFKGPCQTNFIIQMDGAIVAPEDPDAWDSSRNHTKTWLSFSYLKGVILQGRGVIDGSGTKWWANSCKINKTNPCRDAPTALTIDSSSSVSVRDLCIMRAQQIHFTISRSNAIRVSSLRVQSPEDSPNTDGIHVTDSTDVTIQGCQIATGDDCISIANASFNIKMKHIDCGPGHGISIGSLGKDNSLAMVAGIVLDTATLTGTTNGLRIKTWQGGSGYVRSLRFENVRMNDVAFPIIVDQFYCDSFTECKNKTSAVKISEVMYVNISGTSNTTQAMRFACSDTVPCSSIFVSSINLEYLNGTTAETFCNSATGFASGFVNPIPDCLVRDEHDTTTTTTNTTPSTPSSSSCGTGTGTGTNNINSYPKLPDVISETHEDEASDPVVVPWPPPLSRHHHDQELFLVHDDLVLPADRYELHHSEL